MKPDSVCPLCFGDAYYINHHTLECDLCWFAFDESEIIPIPPPVLSDEQWETVFKAEPVEEELAMMDREAEILLESLT